MAQEIPRHLGPIPIVVKTPDFGDSPFFSGGHGMSCRPIEVIVPGDRTGGNGGSSGGGDVEA